jgi:hypothetical protein
LELVPIAGYADRTVTLNFPDLGPEIYVTLRNPKTMAPGALRPRDIAMGPDGLPLNPDDAEAAMYDMLATLVRDWCVYDATSDLDDQPRLPLPATPEMMRMLPMSIITTITEELSKAVNPS